jgi:DNA-binding MltR family transcriptional regulator
MSKRKKEQSATEDPMDVTNEMMKALGEGTPLACALIASANLENALGQLFRNLLIVDKVSDGLLDDHSSVLGTFSAKSDMAYCLGLIDVITYKNLNFIRKIRNKFAHSHKAIDFDDREITGYCSSLDFSQWVDHEHKSIHGRPWLTKPQSNARSKFCWASHLTSLIIKSRSGVERMAYRKGPIVDAIVFQSSPDESR